MKKFIQVKADGYIIPFSQELVDAPGFKDVYEVVERDPKNPHDAGFLSVDERDAHAEKAEKKAK